MEMGWVGDQDGDGGRGNEVLLALLFPALALSLGTPAPEVVLFVLARRYVLVRTIPNLR